MAGQIKILTSHQEEFLDIFGKEKSANLQFYLTGGTALAAFYPPSQKTMGVSPWMNAKCGPAVALAKAGASADSAEEMKDTTGSRPWWLHLFHRLSEDIDLFSEKQEVNLLSVRSFIGKVKIKLGLKEIDYRQYFGLHTFQLYFPDGGILKVDFNYYPFPRLEKGIIYKNIEIDSTLDIAVNKVHTIAMKPRARDFIDIYFLIKDKGYDFKDLLMKAKVKFDWHIDLLQLGSRLLQVRGMKDFPKMLREINNEEWQDFFIGEAKKLKPEVLE